MNSEYSGNVKQFYTPMSQYKPLPQEQPKREMVKDWKKETNQKLREQDTGQTVTNNFFHTFLVIFFIFSLIAMLIMAGYFVYYVGDGKFKSVNTQSVNLEPQINITSNTENQFDNTFNNDANIDLNATIVITNLNIYTNGTG